MGEVVVGDADEGDDAASQVHADIAERADHEAEGEVQELGKIANILAEQNVMVSNTNDLEAILVELETQRNALENQGIAQEQAYKKLDNSRCTGGRKFR